MEGKSWVGGVLMVRELSEALADEDGLDGWVGGTDTGRAVTRAARERVVRGTGMSGVRVDSLGRLFAVRSSKKKFAVGHHGSCRYLKKKVEDDRGVVNTKCNQTKVQIGQLRLF